VTRRRQLLVQAAESRPDSKPTPAAPKPEHIIEAVRWLLEGLPVGDRYLVALIDLVEGEFARRARESRDRRSVA
jgi:hypothetical protein